MREQRADGVTVPVRGNDMIEMQPLNSSHSPTPTNEHQQQHQVPLFNQQQLFDSDPNAPASRQVSTFIYSCVRVRVFVCMLFECVCVRVFL